MSKLQLSVDSSLSGDNGDRLIHLAKVFKEISEDHKYQDIKLAYSLLICQCFGNCNGRTIQSFVIFTCIQQPNADSGCFIVMQILDVLS